MNIIQSTNNEVKEVTKLAKMLWPDNAYKELHNLFLELIKDEHTVLFLAIDKGEYIGFAQCQLRFDYVEGTNSSPVGYLEGIYVLEEYRHQGIGRELVYACEKWSKSKGCVEFGSDVEFHNTASYEFHLKIGFLEQNRIICFSKKL